MADEITSDASTYFAGYEQAGGRQNPVANQLQYESNESLATSPNISDISDDNEGEQHHQDGAREPPRVDPSVDDENIEDEEEQEEEEEEEEDNDAEDSNASKNLIKDLGNENMATSSILQCNEPRAAVERVLLSDPPADETDDRQSRFRMLHDFYTRESPVAEKSFHNREENGSRIVWNGFNSGSSLDRGVNECKFLHII